MWKKSESTEKPAPLDTTSSKTHVYIRKNISEIEASDEKPRMFQYDENAISKEDWDTYQEIMNLQTTTDDITLILAELIGG